MPQFNFRAMARLTVPFALAALLFGCSADSRKSRLLEKADAYFSAGEYENAEIEYKNVLQIEALNPHAIGRMGIIYLDQGRLGKAHPYLVKANELQPENLEVKLKLGYLYLGVNRRTDARDTALFILERRPQDAEAPILLTESVTNASEVAQARARLQQLPPPQGAPVLTALALLDLRDRNIDAALALLERAHKADPANSAAALTLGRVYLAKKDVAAAEKLITSAAKSAPLRSPIRLQEVQFNLQNGRIDAAKRLLAEMNQKTPDFLPAYVILASIAATEKKYEESTKLLDKLFAQEPLHLEALLLAAQVRMASGENDKALATLEKAAAAYPKSPQVKYQLGLLHLAKGDLENASTSLAEAVSMAPDFAQALLGLAQVNIRQRNPAPAVESLNAFLRKNPANADAQLLLADAYRAQQNLDGALGIYRQLAQTNPKNPQVQLLIATVLVQQNKRTDARAALAKALELSPTYLPAVEQLVNLDLSEKKYAPARARLESYIAKDPQNAAAHLVLAKVQLLEGDGAAAEGTLRKSIELKPDSAVPYALLADHYIKTNQLEKAFPALQAAAEKNPNEGSLWMTLGTLYEQRKDFAGARDSYEKALALNPKAADALNNLAYLYSEHLGDLDKAQELAQRARDLPLSPAENADPARRDLMAGSIADTLGWVLFKKGQHARALALLTESSEKLPGNAQARFHLGMAHYMMGDENAARSQLEAALKLDQTFAGAEDARQCLAILAIDAGKAGDKERALLEQSLARRKDDPAALLRLAALYEREGNADKAKNAYESALNASPGHVDAALNVIRIYRANNQAEKALELAKKTRELAPRDGRIAHALGRLAFENGDYLWSVGVLQEAARRQTNDAEVLFDLAEAAYSVGQVSSAATAFRQALETSSTFSRADKAREYVELIGLAQNPSQSPSAMKSAELALRTDAANVPALMVKAALEVEKGDSKAAIQNYNKALARFPDFTPAKRQLTILYAANPEDDKKAQEIGAKARDAFPTDPEIAKAYGVILFRQGNFTRAASLLQESARGRPSDAEVMYYWGMSQRQLKDESGSVRSLRRALELGLSGSLAADARRNLDAKK